MDMRAMKVALLVGLVVVLSAGDGLALPKPKKMTIVGVARALPGRRDPNYASATVTVATKDAEGNTVEVVYYLYGPVAVKVAEEANGKQVEVTGMVVALKNGRKMMTAQSYRKLSG